MPKPAIRCHPMTTYAAGNQSANYGPTVQESIFSSGLDYFIPQIWRKARCSKFLRRSNTVRSDLVEAWEKLIELPRESAGRFFSRQPFGQQQQTPKENVTMSVRVPRPGRSRPHSEVLVGADEERVAQYMATQMLNRDSRNVTLSSDGVSRPISRDRSNSDGSSVAASCSAMPALRNERVVATGNGITVSIALAEPLVFLPGYDHADPSTKRSAILRGHLHIKTTKSVKIKKVSICFRGQAQTDWPDGTSKNTYTFLFFFSSKY